MKLLCSLQPAEPATAMLLKLVAPLAVLSPGPRLAGTPSKGRKLTRKFTTCFAVGKLTVRFFYGSVSKCCYPSGSMTSRRCHRNRGPATGSTARWRARISG
jgi:hypothetical protein